MARSRITRSLEAERGNLSAEALEILQALREMPGDLTDQLYRTAADSERRLRRIDSRIRELNSLLHPPKGAPRHAGAQTTAAMDEWESANSRKPTPEALARRHCKNPQERKRFAAKLKKRIQRARQH